MSENIASGANSGCQSAAFAISVSRATGSDSTMACVLNPALLAAQVKAASAAEQADRRKRSPPSRSAEEGVAGD
jgi:hypothetical protein